MRTVAEIRLANLLVLIDEFGTQDKVAEKGNTSPIYLSQLRNQYNDSKTGRAREMGSIVARKLEAGCGKEKGWMDVVHQATVAATQHLTPATQSTPHHKVEQPANLFLVKPESSWPFSVFSYSDWMKLSDATRRRFENEIAGELLRLRQTEGAM